MASFALDLREYVAKAKDDIDKVTREAIMGVAKSLVEKSPVGDPELWAANAHAMYSRDTHNMFAAAINSDITGNSGNYTKAGNLKRGAKLAPIRSARALKKAFPLVSGKSYVGGRFRGSWDLALGAVPTAVYRTIDPDGSVSQDRIEAAIPAQAAGKMYYIANLTPYAIRLEEGWSQQAPTGMVANTIVEWQNIVTEAVNQVKGGA